MKLKCSHFVTFGSLFILVKLSAAQPCNWPAELVGTWTDSLKGEVVFSGSTMQGWTISMDPNQQGGAQQVRSDWECVSVDQFLTDGIVIMKAPETVTQFFQELTTYRCMQMTKITDESYRYYQLEPEQELATYDRLSIMSDPNATRTEDLCNTGFGASGAEYQVMIAKGNESRATVRCPYEILSVYDYIHTSSDTTVTCSEIVESLDMCTDNSQITFDYNSCPTKVAYSASDTVQCVDSVPVGTTNAVMLYNHLDADAAIDDVTVFRFSCMVINADKTAASITPQHCKANQEPNSVPLGLDAVRVGATLLLTQLVADCPPCPVLTNPIRGTVTISTEGATTLASYTCDPGKDLYGAATRECMPTGNWNPAENPSCTCVPPSIPSNGAFTIVTDVNITVTYTCDDNYVLVGDSVRTCQSETNTWTGADPTCDQCQALATPVNGGVTVVSIGVTSQATYTCGITFSINGAAERICQTDTTWNATDSTCTQCRVLTTPTSSVVFYNTTGTVTSAVFQCAPDYTLIGAALITCSSTGFWDSAVPECDCNDPGTPTNGTLAVSADSSTATYTCELYFTMDGPSVRTCATDGTGWSGADPTCVECHVKTAPTNGTVDVATDGTTTSARFRCDLNFSMDGESPTQCRTDSTWQPADPGCNECPSLSVPLRGSIDLSTDGRTTSAVYECDIGSTLSGPSTTYCHGNGTWSTITAAITCANCETLVDASEGSHTLSTNGTQTSARFRCTSAFKLAGSVTAICDSNGQWDILDQTCVGDTGASDTSLMPAVIALTVISVLLLISLLIAIIFAMRNYQKAKQAELMKKMVKEYTPSPTKGGVVGQDGGDVESTKSIPVAAVPPQHSPTGSQFLGPLKGVRSFIMSKTPSFQRSRTKDRRTTTPGGRFLMSPVHSPGRTSYSPQTVRSPTNVDFDVIDESKSPEPIQSEESADLEESSTPARPTGSARSLLFSVKKKLGLVSQTTDSSVEFNTPAPWKPKKRSKRNIHVKFFSDSVKRKKIVTSPANTTFEKGPSSRKYKPGQADTENPEVWDITPPTAQPRAERIETGSEKRRRAAKQRTAHHKMKVLDEKTQKTPRQGIISVE